VWHWNEWFYAFLYINDTAKLPLQVVLRYFVKGVMIGSIKG
jgi:ABC-type glycerol-3-phosphate transport system permease component